MQITLKHLVEQRREAESHRLFLLSHIQQTVGAIAMLDVMIAKLNEPEPQPVAEVPKELKPEEAAPEQSA